MGLTADCAMSLADVPSAVLTLVPRFSCVYPRSSDGVPSAGVELQLQEHLED